MTFFSRLSIRKSDHSRPHREGGEWVLFLLLLLAACNGGDRGLTAEEQAARDSAALHIAIMPVADCLPFYYAQRTGIFDSLGVDVRVHSLQAQLDTDTALLRRHAHLAYSDLVRAVVIQADDTFDLRAVASTEGRLSLITPRRARVRALTQLRERMVAVARHSITDYWSDRLTDTAGLQRDDIFRPQINDVRIRTAMLGNGTMDAALLPEPYATQMTTVGARVSLTTDGLSPRLACLVTPTWVLSDSSRVRQLRLLVRAYDIAAQRLNDRHAADTLSAMLRQLCFVPDTIADSVALALPRFVPLKPATESDAQQAAQFMLQRSRLRKDYKPDTLLSATLFNNR